MAKAKQVAALLLVGAFLVGGTVGWALSRTLQVPAAQASPVPSAEAPTLDGLYAELRLTAEQRTAMDSLLDARRRIMDSVMAPVRPRMLAVRDSFRAEIRDRLTAEQQGKFETWLTRMRQRDEAERGRAHGATSR